MRLYHFTPLHLLKPIQAEGQHLWRRTHDHTNTTGAAEMIEDISTEAKVMLGMWTLIPNTDLTFQRPHVISDRAATGLRELEAVGLISKTVDRLGPCTYRPTDKLHQWWKNKKRAEFLDIKRAVENHSFPLTDETKDTTDAGA